MLAHTLELPDLHASDVMRNRRELASISNQDEAAAVRRTLQYHRFSRYPYFNTERDDYLGVLHHKDIVFEPPGEEYQSRLRRHLRPIERFREDSPISDLLRQFRLGAPHLALVVDGDDRTVGFVTMEDVLEAIFGEILDEHEQTRVHQIRREPSWLDDERLLVRGDTPLFMVERELRIDLPDSETVSTVTGLLMSQLGHVPQVGDTVEVAGYRASVLRATGAAIESVQFAPIAAVDSVSGDLRRSG